MSKIEICIGDIQQEESQKAMLSQLDLYMQDPMGDFGPMSESLAQQIIKGLKLQPNFLFFLAKYDGEIAGFANCFVTFSTFKAKQLVNIHDIAVDPLFRKKGIGKALMEAIVDYAREHDFCKVTLEVRHDNQTAQQLYQSIGFAECNSPMYFWEKVL